MIYAPTVVPFYLKTTPVCSTAVIMQPHDSHGSVVWNSSGRD